MRSVSASAAAAEVPLCTRCLEHHGLCEPCKPSVLPQLARPRWHRKVHRGENDKVLAPKVSREAAKAQRREARKERKKRERFERALRGEHVKVRHSKADGRSAA